MDENSPKIRSTEISEGKNIFLPNNVDIGCSDNPLKIIFDTLLFCKKVQQQDLANYLQVDKAYVSRVVHGLQIPPLRVRLKIAAYFNVDSSLIWRYEDLNYIKKILREGEEK